jgi:hypothetical protein
MNPSSGNTQRKKEMFSNDISLKQISLKKKMQRGSKKKRRRLMLHNGISLEGMKMKKRKRKRVDKKDVTTNWKNYASLDLEVKMKESSKMTKKDQKFKTKTSTMIINRDIQLLIQRLRPCESQMETHMIAELIQRSIGMLPTSTKKEYESFKMKCKFIQVVELFLTNQFDGETLKIANDIMDREKGMMSFVKNFQRQYNDIKWRFNSPLQMFQPITSKKFKLEDTLTKMKNTALVLRPQYLQGQSNSLLLINPNEPLFLERGTIEDHRGIINDAKGEFTFLKSSSNAKYFKQYAVLPDKTHVYRLDKVQITCKMVDEDGSLEFTIIHEDHTFHLDLGPNSNTCKLFISSINEKEKDINNALSREGNIIIFQTPRYLMSPTLRTLIQELSQVVRCQRGIKTIVSKDDLKIYLLTILSYYQTRVSLHNSHNHFGESMCGELHFHRKTKTNFTTFMENSTGADIFYKAHKNNQTSFLMYPPQIQLTSEISDSFIYTSLMNILQNSMNMSFSTMNPSSMMNNFMTNPFYECIINRSCHWNLSALRVFRLFMKFLHEIQTNRHMQIVNGAYVSDVDPVYVHLEHKLKYRPLTIINKLKWLKHLHGVVDLIDDDFVRFLEQDYNAIDIITLYTRGDYFNENLEPNEFYWMSSVIKHALKMYNALGLCPTNDQWDRVNHFFSRCRHDEMFSQSMHSLPPSKSFIREVLRGKSQLELYNNVFYPEMNIQETITNEMSDFDSTFGDFQFNIKDTNDHSFNSSPVPPAFSIPPAVPPAISIPPAVPPAVSTPPASPPAIFHELTSITSSMHNGVSYPIVGDHHAPSFPLPPDTIMQEKTKHKPDKPNKPNTMTLVIMEIPTESDEMNMHISEDVKVSTMEECKWLKLQFTKEIVNSVKDYNFPDYDTFNGILCSLQELSFVQGTNYIHIKGFSLIDYNKNDECATFQRD